MHVHDKHTCIHKEPKYNNIKTCTCIHVYTCTCTLRHRKINNINELPQMGFESTTFFSQDERSTTELYQGSSTQHVHACMHIHAGWGPCLRDLVASWGAC